MPTINDAFVDALLADASYVNNLDPGFTGGDLTDKLTSRMTPTLAKFIGDNFTVVTSINTPDNVIDGAGFDGVVWRGNAGTPYAGKLFVSMRGTEGVADFVTDANLALRGDAAQQTADMVNWWLRETTPVGQTAPQFAWRLLTSTFENTARAPGTGRISAAELAGGVYVNGHSLGGFLAATFTRVFGTQANVLQTSTFNSAGFAFDSEPVLAALQAKVGVELGRSSFPGPHDTSQLNYFATHGLNLTTNTWWFSQVGQRIELFNEETPTQISNHFMYKLTDALALANAMSKLDPTVTLARANAMFEAGSNSVPASIEGVLDGLRRVLKEPNAANLPVGDVSGFAFSRYAFHDALDQLQQSPTFQSLAGRVRIDLGGKDTGAKARSDFSAMASLLALSPVVLTGTNGANAALLQSTLQGVWGQAFTDWQADATLSLADRQAGSQNFTDEWIADRATLLESIVAHGIKDGSGTAYSSRLPNDRSYELRWVDAQGTEQILIAENTSRQAGVLTPVPSQLIAFGGNGNDTVQGTANALGDHLYGGAGNDTVKGDKGADWLEGNAGNDSIEGGADNDTLWGGAGTDTLEGGTGSDALYGGAGADTYRFSGVWDTDTIRGSDHTGTITVEGLGTLRGIDAKLIGDNVWRTDDERVSYAYVAADGGQKGYLVISVSADAQGNHRGNIRIDDWSAGRLGINLGSEVAPAPSARNYDGDFIKAVNAAQTSYLFADNGGYTNFRNYANAGTQADASDVINGSNAADLIRGFGGNDGLAGGNGNDTIEGGEGNDLIKGGTGADSLLGGAGNDVILGSALEDVNAPYAVGSEREPLPAGWEAFTQGFSWTTLHQPGPRIASDNSVGMYVSGVRGAWVGPVWQEGDQYFIEASGNIIDGGAGNDYIAAGTDADIVHGGADDDDIFGMDDADILFGDGGADFIVGDGFNSTNPDAGYAYGLWYQPGAAHGDDVIDGGAGNDWLWGTGGSDEIYGGADDDRLWGDALVGGVAAEWHGNDYLDGGSGADRLAGNGRDDILFGGIGNDSLWGDNDRDEQNLPSNYYGQDYLDGEDGDDYLQGGGSRDMLIGGLGADTLLGDGQEGLMEPFSAHGQDTLEGGEGNDVLIGGGEADVLEGGAGNDVLHGDDGEAFVAASVHGDDSLDGGVGNDTLYGDGGNDYLVGGDGNDWLAGEDQLNVDSSSTLQGNDTLFGGAGQDALVGGNGDDVLEGGIGLDYFAGGAGNDIYLLQAGDSQVVDGLSETIADTSGQNIVRFGAGVNANDVQIVNTVNAQDLALKYTAWWRCRPFRVCRRFHLHPQRTCRAQC
jgi:trimeric autotransporter adhesin